MAFRKRLYLPYEREEEARFELLSPYEEFSLADPEGRLVPVRVLRREDATQRVKKALAFSNGVNGRYDNFWEDCDHIYECEVSSVLSAPAMGYETYRVVEAKAQDAPGNGLENDSIRIDIEANGSLSIFDKTCNRQYSGMLVFEDQGDAGDSYDYSSVPGDTVLTSEWAQTGNLRVTGNTAGYELEMMIPRNLEQRRAGQMDQRMNIRVELTLQPNKPQCDFRVKVKNPGTDHRLRVKFPIGIKSRFSYADQTFGIIERPTSLETAECWREEGWTEKPRCIEPMQSYVYLRDEKTAVGVIADSVKEYEIVGDGFDTIAYTLFRSFPKMGRANLEDRPGRASGKEWDTPDNMLIGEMEYTFS
ncbi:glycoside hydrolase family 38 C-terminal domain-containing protein, partial [Enterocloster lavalensis]